MKIIKDGNFAPWVRLFLVCIGLLIILFSYIFLREIGMYIGAVAGLVITSVGAYAEKANALKLKPFDNSYKKAKETYSKNESTEG